MAQESSNAASPTPGVFSRNHESYLDEAVARSRSGAEGLTVFRSKKRWKGAQRALAQHGSIPIYFAVNDDSEPKVRYQADLVHVLLDPKSGDEPTERLLHFVPESTRNEALWEQGAESVRTLYLIRRCRKLKAPFAQTLLLKLNNAEPISTGYNYGYSLVLSTDHGRSMGAETLLPGEVSNPAQFWEGATRRVSVTRYERSPAARQACIEHHGTDCAACGFSFEAVYGEEAKGMIHVHHVVPLSSLDESYRIDPVADLIPVCPNCHAVIHRFDPPLQIDELQKMLRANR